MHAELIPGVLYRNLVARNAQNKRVFIQPPPRSPTARAASPQPAQRTDIRVVPNYAAPYVPLLLCTADAVLCVAFDQAALPTGEQIAVLGDAQLLSSAASQFVFEAAHTTERAVTCKVLWLVTRLVARLGALCSTQLVRQELGAMQTELGDDALARLYSERLQVLDMGKIYALKWAALRHPAASGAERLRHAQRLYERVRAAYAQLYATAPEKVEAAAAATLRNMLVDYRSHT